MGTTRHTIPKKLILYAVCVGRRNLKNEQAAKKNGRSQHYEQGLPELMLQLKHLMFQNLSKLLYGSKYLFSHIARIV